MYSSLKTEQNPVLLETLNKKNYLGLKAPEDQAPSFFQRLLGRTPSPWISAAESKRLELKRAAYVDYYKNTYESLRGTNGDAETSAKETLSMLSTNSIDENRYSIAADDPLFPLSSALAAEDDREYEEFVNTLTHAIKYGVVGEGFGRNKHLAQLITLFTYLYGPNVNDNPLLTKKINGVFTHDLLDLCLKADKSQPGWRRNAVKGYMAEIARKIQEIILKSPQQLEMAFPEDNIKHQAVVQHLKRSFNRLSAQIEYKERFINRPAGVFIEKTNDYSLAVVERERRKEHKKLETKLWRRNAKLKIWWIAIVIALIVAGGQMAIAVFAATGALAVAIGVSALMTNTILFWRDIKGVMTALAVKRNETFRGLSKKMGLFLVLFFAASLATGIVSGGLAMNSLVALGGFTLATAPAGLLMATGLVAGLTIVGMTSLFFMVGVGFAKGLRGKSLSNVWTDVSESLSSSFTFPAYNQSVEKLRAQVNDHQQNLLAATDPAVAKRLSALTRELHLEEFNHNARHILKIGFSILLIPTAIIASIIATYALSKASVNGTRDLISTSLKWSDTASAAMANFLTWGPALVVNGSLTTKNLIVVAQLFAAKLGKTTAGIGYGLGLFGLLLVNGRLPKFIKDGIHAYRCNPYKNLALPGIRSGLALAIGAAIALNGYGNGATLGQEGAISLTLLPTRLVNWFQFDTATLAAVESSMGVVTTVVATSSSCALNIAATGDFAMDHAYLTTPLLNLNNSTGNNGPDNVTNNPSKENSDKQTSTAEGGVSKKLSSNLASSEYGRANQFVGPNNGFGFFDENAQATPLLTSGTPTDTTKTVSVKDEPQGSSKSMYPSLSEFN